MADLKKDETLEKIYLSNRKIIEVVGACEVVNSGEKEVLAKLEKDYVKIVGNDLKIVKLLPEERHLVVSGDIFGFEYINKLNKKSFLGKVFK